MATPKQITLIRSELLLEDEDIKKLSTKDASIAIDKIREIYRSTSDIKSRHEARMAFAAKVKAYVNKENCRFCKKPLNPPNTELSCSC